jgi:outer membrane protein
VKRLLKRLSGLAIAGLLLSSVVGTALAADLKIGVVVFDRLMSESPQYKAASESLNREFGGKQRELASLQASLKAKEEKLTKDRATMSADQISKAEKELRDGSRDFQSRTTEFQDDVTARQNEENTRIQSELVAAVQSYAAIQRFDLVLASGVIYNNSTLDITGAVLATLSAGKAPAPAASKAPAAK